ncbi:hypothetical protein [Myxosarcina sp. GI1(2024)]
MDDASRNLIAAIAAAAMLVYLATTKHPQPAPQQDNPFNSNAMIRDAGSR